MSGACVMSGWPAWLVPPAIWSRDARAHARWERRKSRADRADRDGHPFEYAHPIAGAFVYHPGDYLSRRIFLYDDFEVVELQFAVEQARGGGVILDVGANVGLYAVACARAAGDIGCVIAVEPGPRTYEKLTTTCRRLGLSNVRTLNVAASSRSGTALLVSDRNGKDVHQHLADARPDRGDHVPVPIRRLDDVCADPGTVTLVKLDVEGHEVEVLAGAVRILDHRRARLIVECYPAGLAAAGASADELWTVLSRTHRCLAVIAADGSTRPAHRDSLDTDGAEETFNTLWSPRVADHPSPHLRTGLAEARASEDAPRTTADAVKSDPGAC
jgi:FkbM family methyltransferase